VGNPPVKCRRRNLLRVRDAVNRKDAPMSRVGGAREQPTKALDVRSSFVATINDSINRARSSILRKYRPDYGMVNDTAVHAIRAGGGGEQQEVFKGVA